MRITESQIRRIMPKALNENVKAFVATFNKWCDTFGVTTERRVAAFLAQVAVETGELNSMKENMNYSAERLLQVFPKYFPTRALAEQYAHQPKRIGSRVYANRMGNGNEASGDGYAFRGRGCFQLTGKSAYRRYATSGYCNGDLMSHPEWLEQYPGALKSAMWFWKSNNLNRFADYDDMNGLCKAVNGGTNGLANRKYYCRVAKRVFGI